jgi:hypothetical protein
MLQQHKCFCGWREEKVAKSVHCGEPDWTKVAGASSGDLLLLPRDVRNGKSVKGLSERRGKCSILPSRVRFRKRLCMFDFEISFLEHAKLARLLRLAQWTSTSKSSMVT